MEGRQRTAKSDGTGLLALEIMHTIEPARLKEGVTVKSLPEEKTSAPARRESPQLIQGRALVFWDPASLPGTKYAKKLDVPIYIVYSPVPSGGNAGPPASALSDNILDVARGEQIFLSGGAAYEDLARFTGGRLFQADADTQLPPFLESLAQELKSQYVLGFTSTNDAKNDKWRKLQVKMKAPGGFNGIKEKDLKPKVRDRYFVAKPK